MENKDLKLGIRFSKASVNWRKVSAARRFLGLAKLQSRKEPINAIVGGRFQVGKKIANGAFGELRLGMDIENRKETVAIKMERRDAKMPLLATEHRFYSNLGPRSGLPRILYFGECGIYSALVMDLLGPNLEQLFATCGYRFTLKTILLIAIQVMSIIEFVHAKGIVYRDIKPENCCIGLAHTDKANRIYLVDFGLAKEYLIPGTGRHVERNESRHLAGTIRYMSINGHYGKEQSRRDDLESLGYMIFYFLLEGRLPWRGVRSTDTKKRYQIVRQIKEETKIGDMGRRFPWEFTIYLWYCRSLKFKQAPDYDYLKATRRLTYEGLDP